MHRFLNPKALGLALVGLVLIAAMGWLGSWQWGVYDNHQRADAQTMLRTPPVPLSRLLGPDQAFPASAVGRPVTVSGRFLARQQLYVDHLAGARERYGVVTPLRTATGSAILVVRGSADRLGAPAPSGTVEVVGVLEPAADHGRQVDARRVTGSLSIANLVNAVGPDLYSGYIVQRSSTPVQNPRLTPVAPPLPDPSRWAGIRNLLYALQWWVFAAFVAFMWWKLTGDLVPRDEGGSPSPENSVKTSDAGSDSLSPLG